MSRSPVPARSTVDERERERPGRTKSSRSSANTCSPSTERTPAVASHVSIVVATRNAASTTITRSIVRRSSCHGCTDSTSVRGSRGRGEPRRSGCGRSAIPRRAPCRRASSAAACATRAVRAESESCPPSDSRHRLVGTGVRLESLAVSGAAAPREAAWAVRPPRARRRPGMPRWRAGGDGGCPRRPLDRPRRATRSARSRRSGLVVTTTVVRPRRAPQAVRDACLRVCVDGARGLDEHEHLRVCEQRPGEDEPLPLAPENERPTRSTTASSPSGSPATMSSASATDAAVEQQRLVSPSVPPRVESVGACPRTAPGRSR